jgi:hypothetical protein
MNNFIIINRTFCETTPESSEHGYFSKKGFISRRQKVTFRELVNLMKEHDKPSESPNNYNSLHTWYSTPFYTSDYGKGIEREESIHFHRNNTPNAAKYWFLAAKIANKAALVHNPS